MRENTTFQHHRYDPVGEIAQTVYRTDYTLKTHNPRKLVLQYLDYVEKVEKRAEHTVKNKKYILIPFIERLECDDITELTIHQVDDIFIARSMEVKESTLNAERQAMRSFLQYCVEYRELKLQVNYRLIRRTKDVPPKVRTFSDEQIARVLANTENPQDRLMIAVLYETGIRIGELRMLSVEDIRGTQIQIRGKGSRDRVVFMPHSLAVAVREHIVRRRIRGGKVFRPLQAHNNHPPDAYVSNYAIRNRIEAAFKRVGIEMHPHQLRHSFSINWLRKGGDVRTLQVILGHSNLETTMRYLQITDSHTEATYRQLYRGSVLDELEEEQEVRDTGALTRIAYAV